VFFEFGLYAVNNHPHSHNLHIGWFKFKIPIVLKFEIFDLESTTLDVPTV